MTQIHINPPVTIMGIEERKQRERELRRRHILTTAKRLFFQEGFQAVTVEQIAREAELAKGSIYLHFRGKEEIYTQILLEEIDAFYRRIAFLESPKASAAQRLLQLAKIYLELFLDNRELFRIMMNFQLYPGRMNLPEQLGQSLVMSMKKNVDVVELIFAQGMEMDEFSRNIKPFHLRNAYWGMLNGIISHYLYSVPEDKGNEMIHATLEVGLGVFIKGLKAPVGDHVSNRQTLSGKDFSERGSHE